MEKELLTAILDELHEMRKDLRWFREREEQRLQFEAEERVDAAARFMGRSA